MDEPRHADLGGRAGAQLLDRTDALAAGTSVLLSDGAARTRHVHYLGAAGAGKTAVLAALAQVAEDAGALVLQATGLANERRLPFAGLSQLLRPALADAVELPLRQVQVLERVLRIGAADDYSDTEVAHAVLALLELLCGTQRVALILDDLELIDEPSTDVLRFATRRAAALPLRTMSAGREPLAPPDDRVITVNLQPLSPAAARALLASVRGELDPALRETILHTAEGNPLALIELARAAATSAASLGPVAAPLPITTRIRDSFAGRLMHVNQQTRTGLLLAALLSSGEVSELAAAAVAAGVGVPALDEAERVGLLTLDDQSFRFPHPVIASVVVSGATSSEIRHAHELLAQVLTRHPERALLHRASAQLLPDETLANALEQGALALRSGSGSLQRATMLERAATLSESDSARARRLAAAANATRSAGRYRAAEALLARIDLDSVEPDIELDVRSQQAWHEFDTGSVDSALTMLVTLLATATPGSESNIRTAAVAGLARWLSGNHAHDVPLRAALNRLMGQRLLDSPLGIVAAATADLSTNPQQVMLALTRAADAEQASPRATSSGDPAAWNHARLAEAALVLDAVEPARTMARQAAAQLRRSGSFGALTTVLATWSHAEFSAGNWDEACSLAREVRELAMLTEQRRQVLFASTTLAYVAAARGESTDAASIRADIVGWSAPRHHRLIGALTAWGQLVEALGAGELDRAADLVDAMRPVTGTAESTLPPVGALLVASACSDVVEALGRAGRIAEATATTAWVLQRQRRWHSETLAAQAAHAGALLAEFDGAAFDVVDASYQRAVALSPIRGSFAQARTRLSYGGWLRRAHRPADARTHLVRAVELFTAVRAAPWADRAAAELRATGSPSAVPNGSHILGEDLTAQELAVVELAAEGMSNRQIGERLYLSPRTVGSHLYRAYPKLGVSNRAQLRGALERRSEGAGG